MIKAIIIAGFCFTAGNIIWPYYHEPKLFYVPLAIFLSLMILYLWTTNKQGEVVDIFLMYFFWLSVGNVIKQIFYNSTIKQINDYWWGGFLTLILITLLVRWAILDNRQRKSGRV